MAEGKNAPAEKGSSVMFGKKESSTVLADCYLLQQCSTQLSHECSREVPQLCISGLLHWCYRPCCNDAAQVVKVSGQTSVDEGSGLGEESKPKGQHTQNLYF